VLLDQHLLRVKKFHVLDVLRRVITCLITSNSAFCPNVMLLYDSWIKQRPFPSQHYPTDLCTRDVVCFLEVRTEILNII
jgi:hypothetical protein